MLDDAYPWLVIPPSAAARLPLMCPIQHRSSFASTFRAACLYVSRLPASVTHALFEWAVCCNVVGFLTLEAVLGVAEGLLGFSCPGASLEIDLQSGVRNSIKGEKDILQEETAACLATPCNGVLAAVSS